MNQGHRYHTVHALFTSFFECLFIRLESLIVLSENQSPIASGRGVEVLGAPLEGAFSEAPTGGRDVEDCMGVELHCSGSKVPVP